MLESASPAVSDNSTKRSTSFAKTVDDLVHQENALDRARALKAEFDRAKNAHEHSPEKEKTRQTQETAGLSHAPVPEPHLRPDSQIRRAVDRQIDKEKQAKAGANPKAVRDAYKARFNQQHKMLRRDHDRDKD
ncbi:MAG: hypothetical protein WA517_22630 [Candidatus Acidiferrum sp.]